MAFDERGRANLFLPHPFFITSNNCETIIGGGPGFKKTVSLLVCQHFMKRTYWGHCGVMKVGNAESKLYVFVMVLSYSRAVYAEFTLNQKTAIFLRCHERAFEYFGGIPRIILYDNLKSVVLDRRGKDIRFSKDVLDFSGFYCYEPKSLQKLEELITDLQHWFLDIYWNYEIRRKND